MPLDFDGLKKQRFRWALGGIQILKFHWREMLPFARHRMRLTIAQRIHYLLGSVQWFAEVLTATFTVLLLATALATSLHERLPVRQLTGAVLAVPLAFAGTGMLRAVWALRRACRASTRDAAQRTACVVRAVLGRHARVRPWSRAEARGISSHREEQGRTLAARARFASSRAETLLVIAGVAGATAMLVRSPSVATHRARAAARSSKPSCIPTRRGRVSRPRASSSRRSVAPMPARRRTPATGRNAGDRGCLPLAVTGRGGDSGRRLRWSSPRRATNAPFGGPQADLPRIGNIVPRPQGRPAAGRDPVAGRRRRQRIAERRSLAVRLAERIDAAFADTISIAIGARVADPERRSLVNAGSHADADPACLGATRQRAAAGSLDACAASIGEQVRAQSRGAERSRSDTRRSCALRPCRRRLPRRSAKHPGPHRRPRRRPVSRTRSPRRRRGCPPSCERDGELFEQRWSAWLRRSRSR